MCIQCNAFAALFILCDELSISIHLASQYVIEQYNLINNLFASGDMLKFDIRCYVLKSIDIDENGCCFKDTRIVA